MDLNLTDFQGRTLINPWASEADFKISIDDQQFHILFNLHSLFYCIDVNIFYINSILIFQHLFLMDPILIEKSQIQL